MSLFLTGDYIKNKIIISIARDVGSNPTGRTIKNQKSNFKKQKQKKGRVAQLVRARR